MNLVEQIKQRLHSTNEWRDVLVAVGIDNQFLTGQQCACPICRDGDDRFCFDNKMGSGTYICRQCGAGDGFMLVQRFLNVSFRDATTTLARYLNLNGSLPSDPRKQYASPECLKRVWDSCENDGVWGLAKYLTCRGIHHMPKSDVRFAKKLRYTGKDYDGSCPTMVCVFRRLDDQPAALHYTFLGPECDRKAKLEKCKTFSRKTADLKGGAIRLATAEGDHLGVCEGVETALAATELFGITCWATTGTSLLQAFEPPSNIKMLTIYGDNDMNFAGQRAAFTLANRLTTCKQYSHLLIQLKIPTPVQTDWLDMLNNKGIA